MRFTLYALHINTQSVHQEGVSYRVPGWRSCKGLSCEKELLSGPGLSKELFLPPVSLSLLANHDRCQVKLPGLASSPPWDERRCQIPSPHPSQRENGRSRVCASACVRPNCFRRRCRPACQSWRRGQSPAGLFGSRRCCSHCLRQSKSPPPPRTTRARTSSASAHRTWPGWSTLLQRRQKRHGSHQQLFTTHSENMQEKAPMHLGVLGLIQ